jgi:hypothetical protein
LFYILILFCRSNTGWLESTVDIGHYITAVNGFLDDEWYLVDDLEVKKLYKVSEEGEYFNTRAHGINRWASPSMLGYRRVDDSDSNDEASPNEESSSEDSALGGQIPPAVVVSAANGRKSKRSTQAIADEEEEAKKRSKVAAADDDLLAVPKKKSKSRAGGPRVHTAGTRTSPRISTAPSTPSSTDDVSA